MSKLWDMCSKKIKVEAEEFIGRIKSGEIRKIKIYENQSSGKEFNESRALESFNTLTKSEEHQKIMNDYYK